MNKILSKLIVITLFATLASCSKDSSSPWLNKTGELYSYNAKKVTSKEGAYGTLTLLQGDCRPAQGQNPSEKMPSSCMEFPVSRKIRIYEYTLSSQAKTISSTTFSDIKTKYITTIEADNEGFFQVTIPAGKYSFFVEENGILYANRFDGYGAINPVEVISNRIYAYNIRIDYATH